MLPIKSTFIKLVKYSALAITTLLFAIIVCTLYAHKRRVTPPFKDSSGKIIENSLAEFTDIELGGIKQAVLIRSKNINNPVLLYLHGGPGSSELALLRHFNSELENHFTMAIWEQRGAGKSYSLFADRTKLNVAQMINDTKELAMYLKNRFHKNKITLVGHSWGSFLGASVAKKFPELFSAYVGIGQVVYLPESEKISLQYTLEKARAAKNQVAIQQLEKLTDYPAINDHWLTDVFTERKWLGEFGGVMFGQTGMQSLFKIPLPDETTIFDMIPFALGSIESLQKLWPELVKAEDLRKTAADFEIPIYFALGRHDYNVPSILAEDYMQKISAPEKHLEWFENSAHMPNFEEADKFNRFIIEKLAKDQK